MDINDAKQVLSELKQWLRSTNESDFKKLGSSISDLKIGTIIYNFSLSAFLVFIIIQLSEVKDKLETTKAYSIECAVESHRANIKSDSILQEISKLKKLVEVNGR